MPAIKQPSFKNMKIQTRIVLGFGTILFIFAVVSAFTFWRFTRVSDQISAYSHEVDVATVASKIEVEFLRLSALTREYANLGLEEDLVAIAEIEPILFRAIAQAEATAIAPDVAERIADVRATVETYLADFEVARAEREELSTLVRDALTPSADRLIGDLDEISARATQSGANDTAYLAAMTREHALKAQVATAMLLAQGDHILERIQFNPVHSLRERSS